MGTTAKVSNTIMYAVVSLYEMLLLYLEIARRKLINDYCSLDERHFFLLRCLQTQNSRGGGSKGGQEY